MSLSFQERFKNRSSLIGKQGQIDIDCKTAISKPLESQVFDIITKKHPILDVTPDSHHSQNIKGIKQPSSKPSIQSEPIGRKQAQSAKPFRNTEDIPRTDAKLTKSRKIPNEFIPYTLKDYQIIKTNKYYELGGLGPSSIGTDEWKERKENQDKRIIYAQQVKLANSSMQAQGKLKDPEKKISKREKAFQFAKMIPKPLKKQQKDLIDSTPPCILEELEKQHNSYKVSVNAIKSGVN